LQQPFGHVTALQTHWPAPLHSWPVAHAAQAAPLAPHVMFVSFASWMHDPLLQQPLHEPPPQLHVPFVQASPLPQAEHAAPAVPHLPLDCPEYGTQVLPLQQPMGQDVASHTHWPVVVLHSWPALHAPQAAPAAPHKELDSEA
jgi:hypothetical protein